MASLYARGDVLWIRFKDASGKWRSVSTSYRRNNPGERRQAERFRDEQTLKECIAQPASAVSSGGGWSWVDHWIDMRWGSDNRTSETYRSRWRTRQRCLSAVDLPRPRNLSREHCIKYPTWRGGNRNTAIADH
jgi:hypothetical protein